MELVSENSVDDLATKRAFDEVKFALRNHSANLLRILAGAGDPYSLPADTERLSLAFQKYWDATGCMVDKYQIAEMVDRKAMKAEYRPWTSNFELSAEELAVEQAEWTIVKGCMRVVASKLLDQPTQESAGEHLVIRGIKELEAAKTEWRKVR